MAPTNSLHEIHIARNQVIYAIKLQLHNETLAMRQFPCNSKGLKHAAYTFPSRFKDITFLVDTLLSSRNFFHAHLIR